MIALWSFVGKGNGKPWVPVECQQMPLAVVAAAFEILPYVW